MNMMYSKLPHEHIDEMIATIGTGKMKYTNNERKGGEGEVFVKLVPTYVKIGWKLLAAEEGSDACAEITGTSRSSSLSEISTQYDDNMIDENI